ncbi:MAG: DegT/DnrJ/EryC1/StrS family aminotransferase [Acidobacteriota bacterium]
MPKPIVPYFDLAAANKARRAELLAAMSRVLERGTFMAEEEVGSFEEEFAAYLGAGNCVATGSGSDGFRLLLTALGLSRPDVVLCVPNASSVVADAVLQAGPRLDFVDVNPASGLIDLNRLEDRVRDESRPRANAVIAVDLFGQCVDVSGLEALSARYEFILIEDARQAHGALAPADKARSERLGGEARKAGGFGFPAVFSFSPEKNLGALGQGGAVTTGDAQLAKAVRTVRARGLGLGSAEKVELADSQMDCIQAAVLRVKLKGLDADNEARRAVAAAYDKAFVGTGYTEPLAVLPGNLPNRHIYPLSVPDRDDMRAYLDEMGVGTGVHYPVPLHLHPRFRLLGFARGDFPAAEEFALRTMSLPIRPELTRDQVQGVIDAVRSFGGSMR